MIDLKNDFLIPPPGTPAVRGGLKRGEYKSD
jgi:hypothetical protein